MITGTKSIYITVSIFTKSLKQMEDTMAQIREECVAIIQEHIDHNNNEIQIHILPQSRCAHCRKLDPPDCQCGKPNRSPLV